MLSLSDLDGDSCFELSSSVVLVFLVVGKITFLDAQLRNSLSAIGRIIFSFDFLNALISLRELDAFLHVLEIVASLAV